MFAKLSTGTDESEIGQKTYNSSENNFPVSRTSNSPVEGDLLLTFKFLFTVLWLTSCLEMF